MDRFEKAKKDIELSIENPKEYKKEKTEEIINSHANPIDNLVSDLIKSDDSIASEDYVEYNEDDFTEDDDIKLIPLTDSQRAVVGNKAAKIYDAAIKLEENEDLTDDEILSIAQNGIINTKEYKHIKSLDEKEKSHYISELKDLIKDFAYQLAFDVQMEEMSSFNKVLPAGMSEYYFKQYDEMFGYNPETDEIIPVENISEELQTAYWESLNLLNLRTFIVMKKFTTGLRKIVAKRFDWVIKTGNKIIENQFSSNGMTKDITSMSVLLKKIFPDLNELQIRAIVAAYVLCAKDDISNDRYTGAWLYMSNMNIFALANIYKDEEALKGSAKIFYDHLIMVKEAIQKIKVLK